jgi:hypothetical protein
MGVSQTASAHVHVRPGGHSLSSYFLKKGTKPMAYRIKAISTYRPRIEQGNTVQKPELMRSIVHATGLVEGAVDHSIKEMRDQIIAFNRAGRAVKVEGLGTFAPSVDLSGEFTILYRPDPLLNYSLNTPGTFTGTIANREFIGKSPEELVARWNNEHPEDPIAA